MSIPLELKQQIANFLLSNCCNGKVNRGALKEALQKFGTSSRSVKRVWAETKVLVAEGRPVVFHNNRKGIIHKDRYVMDPDLVQTVNLKDRKNIRRMTEKMGIGKTLLHTWIKQGLLRSHSSAIKPTLNDLNKLARLKWSLSQLNVNRLENGEIAFQSMNNTIHIDEKWFFLTKDADKYYLLPVEDEPHRTCKSKRFIPKVMFMCAVARPQKGQNGDPDFDGKLGIFPFITKEPAKRASKNRPKGTLETKAMQSICKQEIIM